MPRYADFTFGEKTKRAAVEAPNAALREVSGRIAKLTYRDMTVLASTVLGNLPWDVEVSTNEVVGAILKTADALASA